MRRTVFEDAVLLAKAMRLVEFYSQITLTPSGNQFAVIRQFVDLGTGRGRYVRKYFKTTRLGRAKAVWWVWRSSR